MTNTFSTHFSIILFFLAILFHLIPEKAKAQNDPVLAGMVLAFTEKAKNEYDSQLGAMALESTGHIWTASEVEGTTDIQKLYNDYLDSFRDIVVYAAQIYGFYQEVSSLVKNYDALGRAGCNYAYCREKILCHFLHFHQCLE